MNNSTTSPIHTILGFVVHDVTRRVEPKAFATREEATKYLMRLTEWQPESRPVIEDASKLIPEALKAGIACAKHCRLNANYHERTMLAALALFPEEPATPPQ